MNVETLLEAIKQATIGNIHRTLIAGIQAPVHCSHAKMGVAGIVDRK